MASAAPPMDGTGHGKSNDNFLGLSLSKIFGYAVKGTALYLGFFAIDAFLDYGVIHSDGFIESGLSKLSTEFLSPLTTAMPEFFSGGMGQEALDLLESVLKGIHRLFGIDHTFIDQPLELGTTGETFGDAAGGAGEDLLPGLNLLE